VSISRKKQDKKGTKKGCCRKKGSEPKKEVDKQKNMWVLSSFLLLGAPVREVLQNLGPEAYFDAHPEINWRDGAKQYMERVHHPDPVQFTGVLPTPVAAKPVAKPAPLVAKPAPYVAKPAPLAAKPAPYVAKPAPLAVKKPTPAPMATARPTPAAAVKPAVRSQVLVVISDHGAHTAEFGKALNTHPCVYDVETPFSYSSMIWSSTNELPECADVPMPDAVFNSDSPKVLMNDDNPQLKAKILKLTTSTKKPLSVTPSALAGPVSPIYQGLKYNIADYFVRIRDLVCQGVPADVCPPSECTIAMQFFPQFVNANTAWQESKDDAPSACTAARNAKAMDAWTKALTDMQAHPKVSMYKIMRNEVDRQFDVFRQFSPPGTQFDCNLQRSSSEFQDVSNTYVDDKKQIETCWTEMPAAEKCLNDALALVGLDSEPMAGKGATILLADGPHKVSLPPAKTAAAKPVAIAAKPARKHELDTQNSKPQEQSCADTPYAIFEIQVKDPTLPEGIFARVEKVGEDHHNSDPGENHGGAT
jgi:hypothetical protein